VQRQLARDSCQTSGAYLTCGKLEGGRTCTQLAIGASKQSRRHRTRLLIGARELGARRRWCNGAVQWAELTLAANSSAVLLPCRSSSSLTSSLSSAANALYEADKGARALRTSPREIGSTGGCGDERADI
jgi:hypothetical protein